MYHVSMFSFLKSRALAHTKKVLCFSTEMALLLGSIQGEKGGGKDAKFKMAHSYPREKKSRKRDTFLRSKNLLIVEMKLETLQTR